MRVPAFLKVLLLGTVLGILGLGALLFGARYAVNQTASGKLHTQTENIPPRDVGLVLGCSPNLRSGAPNPFFQYRIDAATALFKAGKVRYLLVSGANPSAFYNEPSAMRAALIERGVPAEYIFKDYAGLRTLDSVVRAKKVFQTDRLTIISQDFHLRRALYIADHYAIDCIGFAARDLTYRSGFRVYLREAFARVKMLLDLHVLSIGPRHLGEPETIGRSHN